MLSSLRNLPKHPVQTLLRYSTKSGGKQFNMTKITCTLGPSSSTLGILQDVADAGMSIGRVNFSHVKPNEYEFPLSLAKNVRNLDGMHTRVLGRDYNMTAMLLDTKGPEIRTGVIAGQVAGTANKYIDFVEDEEVLVTTNPVYKDKCDDKILYVDYNAIGNTVNVGSTLLIDDGLIGFEVKSIIRSADEVLEDGSPGWSELLCRVDNGGSLGSSKGVNIPNTVLQLPAMTPKDKDDMLWAIRNNVVDIVAASFVRKGGDVRSIKAHLERCIMKVKSEGGTYDDNLRPWIVSKIENKEGVDNFEEILKESDGIMIARGDLGVEIPFAELLILQKRMIRLCNLAGKPVIVATQMLDSMQRNPRPTRAEVTDVGNAVLDGADCVMLSGESANGKYPVESVETMSTIVMHADEALDKKKGFSNIGARRVEMAALIAHNASSLDAICSSAIKIAEQTDADLIIAISRLGATVQKLAKYRPGVPIMAFVPNCAIGRRLVLHRGVYPIVMEKANFGGSGGTEHDRVVEAMRTAKEIGWIKTNNRVVVVDAELWDLEAGSKMTKANCIKIFTV